RPRASGSPPRVRVLQFQPESARSGWFAECASTQERRTWSPLPCPRSSLSHHGCLFERPSDTPSWYGRLCVRVCSAPVPARASARQFLSSRPPSAASPNSTVQGIERVATIGLAHGPDSATHGDVAAFRILVSLQ